MFDLKRTLRLVDVHATDYETLSPSFIEYDTAYITDDARTVYYNLPKGELIILYLVQDNIMMTTVRRYIVDKYNFYYDLIGKEVMIKVIEE